MSDVQIEQCDGVAAVAERSIEASHRLRAIAEAAAVPAPLARGSDHDLPGIDGLALVVDPVLLSRRGELAADRTRLEAAVPRLAAEAEAADQAAGAAEEEQLIAPDKKGALAVERAKSAAAKAHAAHRDAQRRLEVLLRASANVEEQLAANRERDVARLLAEGRRRATACAREAALALERFLACQRREAAIGQAIYALLPYERQLNESVHWEHHHVVTEATVDRWWELYGMSSQHPLVRKELGR